MSGFLGMFAYGGAAAPVVPSIYIAYGGPTVGKRICAYNWDSTTGFGSSFTAPTISNAINQVSFVKNNSNISASCTASPFFFVWQWSASGFGTQYANAGSPLSPSGSGPAGFSWTNNVDAILTSNAASVSYPQAWAWDQTSGFGTKYANGPALNSSALATGVTLNGDNTQVAFSQQSSPVISLFPWSSSAGFGTKYANPASLPPFGNNPETISFNPVTNDVAIGSTAFPLIAAYPVTSSGFGTRYANPSTSVGGTAFGVRFSPSGSEIAVGNNSTPASLKVYQWSSGFGSLYSSPTILQTIRSVSWSSTGTEIAGAIASASPYTKVYPWTSSGFGSAYSNPTTALDSSVSVSFSDQSR